MTGFIDKRCGRFSIRVIRAITVLIAILPRIQVRKVQNDPKVNKFRAWGYRFEFCKRHATKATKFEWCKTKVCCGQ